MSVCKNILVWQWGKKGAGPKIAVELAKALKQYKEYNVLLSLSENAEILSGTSKIICDFPVKTYQSISGFLLRWIQSPWIILSLICFFKPRKIDLAICAMSAPLDLLMVLVLRWLKIPFVLIVHDAQSHPGDRFPMQYLLQRRVIRHAKAVITFSNHVCKQLIDQKQIASNRIICLWHPPFDYGISTSNRQPSDHIHLLYFGRLLPYKGLDLLEEALKLLHTDKAFKIRIIGSGPQNKILELLAAHKNVVVENRWVPDEEIASLIEWSDAILLPYREASQSGVAAIALAAAKYVLSTNVGGLVEQFQHEKQAILCDPTPEAIALGLADLLQRDLSNAVQKDCAAEWSKMTNLMMQKIKPLLGIPHES